jgi:PAS domain S-box-containing protein
LGEEVGERRRAEASQRRSEAFLLEGQRLSHTGSWRMHLKTGAAEWTPEQYRVMGVELDPSDPPSAAAILQNAIHPEDQTRVREIFGAAVRNRTDYEVEYRVVRPDNSVGTIVTVGHPVVDETGDVVEIIGTSVDITAARAAEAEIRRQAELLNLTHDALIVREHDGRIRFWNRAAEEIYGWTAPEALGRPSQELLRTTFPVALAEIEAITRDQGHWEGELVQVRRDGSPIVVASRWSLERDHDGRPTAVLETNTDITVQKRADQELRRSERRYRTIFEKVGVAIVEQDYREVQAVIDDLKAKGVRDFRRYLTEHPEVARETLARVHVTGANDAAVALFGAASQEDFLRALPRLTTREVEAAWHAQLPAVAEGRKSVEEVELTTLAGEKVAALVTIVLPPESSDFERVLVTIVDLTEPHRTQEALRQAQAALAHVTRVRTLGELTASIAHEVNQPIGAIANNANACLVLLPESPELAEVRAALTDIVTDATRAGDVIAGVRTLARRAPLEREPLRFGELVRDVVALAASESGARRVSIRCDVPEDLPIVLGDRVQLQQVLLNLVVNGLDAMGTVGEDDRLLEIRGGRTAHDGQPAVSISVRDHGVGLAGADGARLFEPFYTTKPNGMGMGLAISRAIIEAHSGRLWAEANPERGATFSFTVPANT